MSVRFLLGAAVLSIGVAACGSTPPAAEAPAAESAPAADHAGHVGGRVFWVTPKDGETIKNGHRAEFGSEMFTIAAVPEGEVTEVRAGTGHYHVGFDTECLPAGTVIPKADPWQHFGTGSNWTELNLTPGQHTLVLQAGDDKHATMTGLCEKITITVQ